jgi:hypothetical protein
MPAGAIYHQRRNVPDVNDEQLMTRFLLGDSLPAEREAIEERLASDPGYFEALAALEDELILKWHRGELTGDQRRFMTRSNVESPARAVRIAAGRDLIDAAERWTAADAGASPWWRWLTAPAALPRFAAAGALAALVAAVSLGVVMTSDATRRLQRAEAENAALRQQADSAKRFVVAFTLAPVGDRGAADGTNLVLIPGGADEVWLQVEVTDVPAGERLDATVERVSDAIVSASRPMQAAVSAAASHAVLSMAAGDLGDGDYVLRLRRTVAGGSHSIATRTFRVVRR